MVVEDGVDAQGVMHEEAEPLQALALAYLQPGASDADLRQPHRDDPSMTTDLWYERYCLETSQVVQLIATSRGLECEVVCGLLVGPKHEGRYPRPWKHAWLEIGGGI